MKIQVFALGGLGENGKNLYVVNVEEQLFIMDVGIKYPTKELYGIDEIIPEYKPLLSRKEKIKGIFLTHAHEDHIGALYHILEDINVPVYATNFTMELIKDQLLEKGYDLDSLTLITINENSTIKFGNVKVTFFKTTHSIPESVGIAIQTLDGVIVYTSDYTFHQSSDEKYKTDFQKINEIAENGVLLLMTESLGSDLTTTSKTNLLDVELSKIFSSATDRIIVSLFSSDLQKIQKVIDVSIAHNKRIAIIGRKAQRIVHIALKMDYLNIPDDVLVNLKYIDDNNYNDDPDLVCLVTGDRHEPFYMLQRMVKKVDRLIHINEYDTIVLMTSPIPGTEKMAAKTLDTLYRTEASVKVINKEFLKGNHATADEIKMMIGMLKPKYIMPVIGEYRMQHHAALVAKEMGYSDNEVFLLDNGDVLRLDDKRALVQRGRFKTGDILIDGASLGDINDFVIHDRELLSEDGVLVVISHLDPKEKKMLGSVEVITKGFIPDSDVDFVAKNVKELTKQRIEDYLDIKYINWNDLKNKIRDDVNKFLYKEYKRRPVTIPVIIAIENQKT